MTARATGLRVVAALAAGCRLGRRPRSQVVHIVRPCTPTPSRRLPRAAGTVNNCRTRQLREVSVPPAEITAAGWRFCRCCTAALPPSHGAAVQHLLTRDDDLTAYGHLTIADLTVAGRWCQTVDDTYVVGRVARTVHGMEPFRKPTTPGPDLERWELERTILARRDQLRLAEMTDEERADRVAAVEDRTRLSAELAEGRRRSETAARAIDRAHRGQYLRPHERDLLNARHA